MSLTYTLLKTEIYDKAQQKRILRGYEIPSVGVVLNLQVLSDTGGLIFDVETFIPTALAPFVGMSWTVADVQDLGMNQKRYVRVFVPATNIQLVELYRTVVPPNKDYEVIVGEQIYHTRPDIF